MIVLPLTQEVAPPCTTSGLKARESTATTSAPTTATAASSGAAATTNISVQLDSSAVREIFQQCAQLVAASAATLAQQQQQQQVVELDADSTAQAALLDAMEGPSWDGGSSFDDVASPGKIPGQVRPLHQ